MIPIETGSTVAYIPKQPGPTGHVSKSQPPRIFHKIQVLGWEGTP